MFIFYNLKNFRILHRRVFVMMKLAKQQPSEHDVGSGFMQALQICTHDKKAQAGNDQEISQSEKNPHSINGGVEKKLK